MIGRSSCALSKVKSGNDVNQVSTQCLTQVKLMESGPGYSPALVPRLDDAADVAAFQSRVQRLTGVGFLGVANDRAASGVGGNGVAAVEDLLGAEEAKAHLKRVEPVPGFAQAVAGLLVEAAEFLFEYRAALLQKECGADAGEALGQMPADQLLLAHGIAGAAFEA